MPSSTLILKYHQFLVVVMLAGVTLLFSPRALDPFSLPKLIFLLFGTALLLPLSLGAIRDLSLRKSRLIRTHLILVSVFLAIIFTSALVSQNPVNGFWGEYGRNNGFLAYFCLTVLAIGIFSSFDSSRALIILLAVVSLVANSYGVMQHYDADFVVWNNPFNPVITTFGNPNFAGAFAGIAAGAYVYLVLFEKERLLKYLGLLGLTLSIAVIFFSQVTQALFTFAVSVGLTSLYWLYLKSKRILLLALIVSGTLALISFLGVFRMGPLAEFLGKTSFLYRTDYWQAAWKMMISNPWLGVGADQYGNFFQEFRTLEQINRANAAVMANNAHNIFLQVGATIGVIGLIVFLILLLSPIVGAAMRFNSLNQNNKPELIVCVAIFAAYLVQATVSIDHIALAIWGWAFGAIILKINHVPHQDYQVTQLRTNHRSRKKIQPLLIASFISCIIVSPTLIQKISYDIQIKNTFVLWPSDAGRGPTDPTERRMGIARLLEGYGEKNYDPQYTLVLAKAFDSWDEHDLAIRFAKDVIENEPRSYDAWNLIANIYERTNQSEKSISYRVRTINYDPNNYENKLKLALTYQKLGVDDKSLALAREVIRDCPPGLSAYQPAANLILELKS